MQLTRIQLQISPFALVQKIVINFQVQKTYTFFLIILQIAGSTCCMPPFFLPRERIAPSYRTVRLGVGGVWWPPLDLQKTLPQSKPKLTFFSPTRFVGWANEAVAFQSHYNLLEKFFL